MLKKTCMIALGLLNIVLSAETVNLLKNGSFEDEGDKSYHFKGTKKLNDKAVEVATKEEVSYGVSTDKARTGTKSFRFQSNIQTGGTEINYGPKIPMQSGTKYAFSAYYFIKAGENSGKPRVSGRVIFWDKDNKVLSYLFPEAPSTQNEWLQLKIEFFPPVGAVAASLTLWSSGDERTIWWDDLALEEIKEEKTVSSYSSQAMLLENTDMSLWINTPNAKTPYKGIPENIKSGKLEITCARNESEPVQLVLTPKKDLGELSLDFSDLKNSSGAIISKQNLTYKPIGFIDIKESDNPTIIGMNADPLMPEKTASAKTGTNTPFWVLVQVPEKSAPGTYAGNIRIMQNGTELTKVPLAVKVRSFAIPTVSTLKSAFYGRCFPTLMGKLDKRPFDTTTDDIFENLKIHRITGNQAYGVPTAKYKVKDNILEITDWSPVDNFISEKVNKYNISWLKMDPLGFYGDNDGWFDKKNKTSMVFGKDIQSPEGRSLLTQYIKLLSAHLKEKGWFDKCSSYIWDEPSEPYLKTVADICDAMHSGDKNFDILVTRKITNELKGKINTWCLPFAPGYIDMEEMFEASKRGEKMWIYNWPIRLDDYGYINNRIFPWFAYMVDAEGVLLWNIIYTNGTINPWTEMGKTYANGGATLLYPHPSGNGPYITSQRFAMVKEAVDDYDYFKVLENKIESVKKGWGKPRVKEIIGAVIYNPPFDYVNDSSLLYHIRDEIADEIESMDRKPILLAQTKPADNSHTIMNEVQLEGVCEQDAKVKINDEEISSDNGTFSKKVSLKSIGKNIIKIDCTAKGETKTVYRTITLDKDPQLEVLKKLLDKAAKLNIGATAFKAVYDAASNASDYSEKQKMEVSTAIEECQKSIIKNELAREVKNAKNKLYTAFFNRAKWAIEKGFFEKAEHYLQEAGKMGPEKDLSKGACTIEAVKKDGHFGFVLKNSLIEVLILESGARILDFKVNGVACLNQGNPKDYPEEVRADMKKCIEAVELKFRPNLGGYEDAGMEQMASAYADWKISLTELKPDRISIAAEINIPGGKFRLQRVMTITKDDPRLAMAYTIKNIQPSGFKSDDPHAYDFPWRGHTDIAIGGKQEGNILVIPSNEKLQEIEFSSSKPVFYERKTMLLSDNYAGSFAPSIKTGFAQILDEKIKHLYIWFQAADNSHGSARVYTIEPNKSIGVPPFILEPGKEVSFTNYFIGLKDVTSEEDFKKQMESYKKKAFGK